MSLAKRIIPCLDVDNGRVVKGVKFVDIRDQSFSGFIIWQGPVMVLAVDNGVGGLFR